MGFKMKSVASFKDLASVGLDRLPIDSLVQVKGDTSIYELSNKTNINSNTTIQDAISQGNLKAILKNYFDDVYLSKTGDETIAGIKTFSSFPVTPSSVPTTDYQVANKKYVDDNAGISLATANSYDLGVGQTWQNVTASRSAGVTYTNTTGKPIVVNVFTTPSATNAVAIIVDGNNLGYNSFTASNGYSSNRNIVPNGSTYSVIISGSSVSRWFELR